MRRSALVPALAAAAAVALAAAAARAEVYGLIVGADAYEDADVRDLKGAVNDARDIAAALHESGAREVRLLIDGQARRQAIVDAFRALAAQAGPGDVIVFSYAGHGGREPERLPGDEADGMDDAFLLPGYSDGPPGNAERLVDNDVLALLAEEREARIVFVTDSCFSGTMTRSVDTRAEALGTRYTAYGPIAADALPPPTSTSVGQGVADLPNVVHLASSLEDQVTPELLIDGQARGALSWAFARALRGAADADGDGRLQVSELQAHVIEAVRAVAESRQTPSLRTMLRGEEPLLKAAAASSTPTVPALAAAPLEPLPLAIVGADADRIEMLYAQLRDVTRTQPGGADLIWDDARQEIVSGLGDVVAHPSGLAEAQSTIDKWRLLKRIRLLAEGHPLAVRVTPDDRVHSAGDNVRVALADPPVSHLLVFNLSGTGMLNFLYPREDDPPLLLPERGFAIDARVTSPFGADHVVALATAQPPEALLGLLRILDGQTAGDDVAAALGKSLAEAGAYRLGYVGLYTAEH